MSEIRSLLKLTDARARSDVRVPYLTRVLQLTVTEISM